MIEYRQMAERVVPFQDLTTEERSNLTRVNWTVRTTSGQQIPDWAEIHDARYGTLRHVAIINDETGNIFDKVDLEWSPAAFVVIYRMKGNRREYLLPSERRVLLKDENGIQGDTFIPNIVQGMIRVWNDETPEQAAIRETKEEVGIDPKRIEKMDDLYINAANSQVAMPFFLVEVDSSQLQQYIQSIDPTEAIRVSEENWVAIEDIPKLRLQCAKTLAGLFLAEMRLLTESK